MSTTFRVLSPLATDTETHSLRQEFEALRRHVFVHRMGWEAKSDRDGYDPYADYVVAIKNHEIIRGCRLIVRQSTGQLPIEHLLFENAVDPNSIEVSRLASHGAKCYGFYGFLLDHLIEQGYSTVYMTIRERLLKMFEHKGPKGPCHFHRLDGRPLERHGNKGLEYFIPAMISVAGMREILRFLECFDDASN